ncbi:hypothetical protein BDR04DRAFT_1093402 [Suillus decipiens]|nr:hypothetical protein BDR04DRAFT_1093402 [Suillus decipiens]
MSWFSILHVSNVLNGCYETFSNTGRSISGISVLVRPSIYLHSTLAQGSRNHHRLLFGTRFSTHQGNFFLPFSLVDFAAVFLLAFAMGFLASIDQWESSFIVCL